MTELTWNWLCVPYLVCSAAILVAGMIAAMVHGDRVLRLGAIGAATTALPWSLCTALTTWSQDHQLTLELHRLGNGPIALVGPSLLLVLLGVGGQLERYRWLVRAAGLCGLAMMIACWATDWTISGVQRLSSGILYPRPGPLAPIHFSSMGIWLALGIVIARRSARTDRNQRRLLLILALVTLGASDMLPLYSIAGSFPLAWLSATIAAVIAARYQLATDLLRPQGLDRGVVRELISFAVAMIATAVALVVLRARWASDGEHASRATMVAVAAIASIAWVVALSIAWSRTRSRPAPVARERALAQFTSSLAAIGDAADPERELTDRLSELWRPTGASVQRLVPPPADRAAAAWLVEHSDPVAATDLNTMLLGNLRPALEGLFANATLVVPLIDRGELIGMIEANHVAALREDERGVVSESARAVARALAYVTLAREAGRERETAREVEVAEALRLAAEGSRDAELGQWVVASEYRSAPRTTSAGWSTSLLDDGRLALMVTEAQAHGVAAALATAALGGAFVAATAPRDGGRRLVLDDVLVSLQASAEGVVRGGEPVAAFVALLDGEQRTIEWASAGHPGGLVVSDGGSSSIQLGGGGVRLAASLVIEARGTAQWPPGAVLAVASSGTRGDDDGAWAARVRAATGAGPRLPRVVVEQALAAGAPTDDLLAVVVYQRDRR